MFDRDAIKGASELIAQSGGDLHPSVPVVASAESPGRPAEAGPGARQIGSGGSGLPPDIATSVFDRSTLSWERLAREQQGYASLNALRAVIEGLSVLPGRKSVVFFAEGLALPEAVLPQFDSVVATANRANVTVYTVDAAGLRVHSKDAETGREIRAAGAQSMIVNPDGSTGGSLGALERLEDVLRKDPRTSLTLLADRTGGFLIENTNDLARGFQKIDTDRRFHYLLTYTPNNQNFDGELAKHLGARAVAQGRAPEPLGVSRGALAVGDSAAGVRRPGTRGARSHAAARRPAAAPGRVRLSRSKRRLARGADGGGQRAHPDVCETPDGFRTDFLLMARVKHASGEIVRKGSQPYRLTGPAADRDRTQKGEVLFYRQPELPPGRYTVEGVVHDALASRAGVARLPLEVPADTGVRVSSLVIVSRTERLMSGELDR